MTVTCHSRTIFMGRIFHQTHYEILEVSDDALLETIKKSYIEKSKKYHPDRHDGNVEMHEMFVKINEAYTVLTNPNKRASYDYTLHKRTGIPRRKPPDKPLRSKDYKDPYINVKRGEADWTDFFNSFGGSTAYSKMMAESELQFWKDYWEASKKYGGPGPEVLEPSPMPDIIGKVRRELFVVVTILMVVYVLGLFFSSASKKSVDHIEFDISHNKWLLAQKKNKD